MSIKNILNKIFKKSESEVSSDINIKNPKGNNIKIVNTDSYCYSNIIWNSENYLIMLLSFSKDYFSHVIELQDAIHASVCDIISKVLHSSYEENTGRFDPDGDEILIIHEKHYLLIGGTPEEWESIYMHIDNLSNNVLNKISDEIANNCYSKHFKNLIKDGIISRFEFHNHAPDNYDKLKYIEDTQYTYADPEIIMSRLPNGFTGKDILKFIKIFSYNAYYSNALYELACLTDLNDEDFVKSKFYPIYETLFKNPKPKKLKVVFEPVYKQPDDDSIAGDIDDESLDTIFREHYERFSALADEAIHYEDIDEQIEIDDEELQSEDILNGTNT